RHVIRRITMPRTQALDVDTDADAPGDRHDREVARVAAVEMKVRRGIENRLARVQVLERHLRRQHPGAARKDGAQGDPGDAECTAIGVPHEGVHALLFRVRQHVRAPRERIARACAVEADAPELDARQARAQISSSTTSSSSAAAGVLESAAWSRKTTRATSSRTAAASPSMLTP